MSTLCIFVTGLRPGARSKMEKTDRAVRQPRVSALIPHGTGSKNVGRSRTGEEGRLLGIELRHSGASAPSLRHTVR